MIRGWCFMVGLLLASQLQAQTLVPKDFAYGQVVIPTKQASAYRISLPLDVYQDAVETDLADLRVFNAEGIAVPYSLSKAAPQSLIHQEPVALPLFPLPEGARVQIDGVHLTINSAGSAVNLQTQSGSPAQPSIHQYLMDARATNASISALQLSWPDAAEDYTGRLRIEVSDDLAAWRPIVAAAPIANLHANGQSLIENRVTVAPTVAKFWRLSWLGASPGFALIKVLAKPADSPTELPRSTLEAIGTQDSKNPQEYSFNLGAHPPVSRLNVLLPDLNTVIDAEISSKPTVSSAWRTIARAGFYRLKNPDAEQQNAPLEINPDTDRFWRLRILSVGAPQTPPRLSVQWIPNEVTFLAQGHAPYLLVYGNASAKPAESDLSHLPNTLDIAPATLAAPQALGGASRLIAQPAPLPWTRIVLWGVLAIAVLLLAWMARGIAKETGEKPQ
jgi:Protein of unknown function (DUF3999)